MAAQSSEPIQKQPSFFDWLNDTIARAIKTREGFSVETIREFEETGRAARARQSSQSPNTLRDFIFRRTEQQPEVIKAEVGPTSHSAAMSLAHSLQTASDPKQLNFSRWISQGGSSG